MEDRTIKKFTSKSGFSILELLIALTLMAALLTSVGIAMKASFQSYSENEKIAAATQAGRSVLGRITNDIRTAEAVDSTSTQVSIIPPDNAEGVQLIQYEFDGGTLYYRRTVNGTTTSYVLLGGNDDVTVSSFNVDREVGVDWQGNNCTKSITLQVTFVVDDRTLSLTASADPRRNQIY